MYKNVKMFACLSEIVKEVDGKRIAVQDLYVLDGKLMAQLAFRGVEINGNYEQVKDAYRKSRLYFNV